MSSSILRIGIAGCGHAAGVHLERLLARGEVRVVGCADADPDAAEALAGRVPGRDGGPPALPFSDHRELLRQLTPDALAVFTPHLGHYRPAMDALQAGCHVFIENPLSTNVQEAADIVNLARGRGLKVGVGHPYRLLPSLAAARERVARGALGAVRLVTAVLARPAAVNDEGILSGDGNHLIDALLWASGRPAVEAASVQNRRGGDGPDLVTAAAVRLADGTPATLGVSGLSRGPAFEICFYGEAGRLRATDVALEEDDGGPTRPVPLGGAVETLEGNFVEALTRGAPLCCPADEALDAVRLLEAIGRSAATGQVVRLA